MVIVNILRSTARVPALLFLLAAVHALPLSLLTSPHCPPA